MSVTAPPQRTSQGLHDLVAALRSTDISGVKSAWQSWFDGAAEQLECDDSFDPHLTDQMVDCLVEADEALNQGGDIRSALNRLVYLYDGAEPECLESRWLLKASLLGTAQLETQTWTDLSKALEAANCGRSRLVETWLDRVEDEFLSVWESYETSDVLEEEITTESVLCHRFLMEGVEGWLEALAIFRETLDSPDREAILECAEQAQRLLILVQLIETETEEAFQRFFVHYN